MPSRQDSLYEEAASSFGPALARLARAYESNRDSRQELLHEIHVALWRSFARFEGRCSIRTWVFRVAHNVAASHVERHQRSRIRRAVSLDALDLADPVDYERGSRDRMAIGRLLELIHELRPTDTQLMVLYLEDFDSTEIAEITGLSPGAVRVQIHRLKTLARPLPGLPSYFYVLVAIGLGLLAIVRYRSARVLKNELRAVDAIARL